LGHKCSRLFAVFGQKRQTGMNKVYAYRPGRSRSAGQALSPIPGVSKQGRWYAFRVPKRSERGYVRRLEPMGFPVTVHGPPLGGFRSGFPINTGVHKGPLWRR
jgi:hypothetical protein